mmetsp:Transcript_88588/g.247795  ORF Transcript_88588/g.247795 Transcript_88588/m.247795 type:complete len:593 (-) Transcript_88588:75-1853(-)|eukprot:CAMPEP_0176195294 /NCGR_PEP_ID=MMETSP0121_2-20121125/6439_1 /TAXON_ID=160619 /ORGANISM="Kryptoperidinium foliaceum, Strain CCMP 1326" /LENGTH=592 /DNA_ID=CAMNT_0017534061 /DNA_START=23 /DNA_END=1801 /DNA_ORIENTATION=+
MKEETAALLPSEAAPAATPAAQVAAQPENGDTRRQELADGIPTISQNESVSPQARSTIAGLRTLVLCAVCGSALFAMFELRGVVVHERVWENHVTLLASLCEDDGIMRGLDPEPDGFLDLVKEEQRKVITFEPVGPAAKRMGLPIVRYYASEEFKAGGPRWSLGYSLGMFPRSELHFVVAINDTKCLLPDPSDDELMMLGMAEDTVEDRAVIRLGFAVVRMLGEAGRRLPHAWTTTAPKFHGPMLIRQDTDQVWEASSGVFGARYTRSYGWNVYWIVTIALRLAGGVALHLFLGVWISREWHRAVDTWIVQYDRFWTHQSLRGVHSAENDSRVFRHRIQCCSSFFVLDHAAGDAQTNSEDAAMGITSAMVHGAIMVGLVVLPNVMACFFSEWKVCVWVLSGLHLVSAMAYGGTYYCNARFRTRAPFLYVHLGSTLVMASFSLFYLWSVVLFILTRPFVMPDEAMVYSVSVGTVVVYVVVVAHQLQKLREGLLGQLQGKESKGKVISFLKYLGLDVRTIICSVFGGALLVLMVALMILLAGEMYISSGPISTISTAFGTTCTAFTTMFAQLRHKQEAQEESVAGIPSFILDLV